VKNYHRFSLNTSPQHNIQVPLTSVEMRRNFNHMTKNNLPIIIGIALPIVFILIISIVIFGPSVFVKPQHNFIYTIDDGYNRYNNTEYSNTYAVENNHIVLVPPGASQKHILEQLLQVPVSETETYTPYTPILYEYDVKTNSSHQINFDEAKNLIVDPGPSSPDGYTVEYEYRNDGIFGLFGSSGNSSGFFISKNNGKRKLNALGSDVYWNQGNFKLIGWVK